MIFNFFTSIYRNLTGKFIRHYRESGSVRNLLLHSSLTLTFTSGLSYALGLIRDKTFAYRFGASSTLDIYNASFVVPDFLFAVIVSGALSAAFVPIFTSLDEKSRTRAFEYINQVLSWLLILISIFAILFAIFLPYLVQYLVPGFNEGDRLMYITTTRILLIAPLFFTLSNTFGYALLSTRDFLWYGLAPVMYNIGIILGVLVLVPLLGWQGLVIGTVIGALLHMLLRAYAIWNYGFRFKLSLYYTPELKETIILMLPRIIQIASWQLMLWWFIRLASSVGQGSVTIYNFAYNFQSLPVSLIGIAIALSSFAKLSHLSAHENYSQFRAVLKESSLNILALTILSGGILAVIAKPLVTFFLGGGRFDEVAISTTALMISVYAISVPLESLMHLLARAHYALKNTMIPSLIQIFSIMSAMFISSILVPRYGLFALPLGFSAGFAIQCLVLSFSILYLLKRREKSWISG